ncbi:MAG: ABC transporter ATP-binding protein [Trueperaceae bacterium]|nr:ABC transporter ATP-binding protein [Trueperaceae bacterium]
MTTIVASGIHKSFSAPDGHRFEALADVDLQVENGEFVCLLGPSGCGKTTLLNVLAGLISADRGTVEVRSEDGRRPRVRTVFQESRLLPWMTVRENLAFVLDGPDDHVRPRVDAWLHRVGLDGTQDYYPHQLSIGMQQRVSVARGLIVEPDVLFMDEPFGALDELTAMAMREELLDLWEDIGLTIVFVTHNPLEAAILADRIVIMGGPPGRITHQEDVAAQLSRPRDPDDLALWRLARSAVKRLA